MMVFPTQQPTPEASSMSTKVYGAKVPDRPHGDMSKGHIISFALGNVYVDDYLLRFNSPADLAYTIHALTLLQAAWSTSQQGQAA
jgi:hypothetical protein